MLIFPLASSGAYMTDWMKYCWNLIAGLFMSFVGYLLPIRDIVHLLILFFIIDALFGYWAARKLRNEKFSAKIIWKTTMPRMLISLVLIVFAYLWDSVYQQDFVATYKLIGWFISGVLLASIVQNGYQITNWNMFAFLGDFLKQKIRENTGVDIPDKNNKHE